MAASEAAAAAAEDAAATTKVTLKLILDTKSQKVLFAEAGKEFVDFLFNTLSLPLATVIRLLTKQQMVGSLPNLYQSIETLNQTYIQPNQQKDTLLKPVSPIPNLANQLPFLPLADATMAANRNLYRCGNYNCSYRGSYIADNTSASCPKCDRRMDTSVDFVHPPVQGPTTVKNDGEGGFVKGVVTYMVMDDLVVMPLSIISSINMLNKFNVKEVGSLEEMVVDVGMEEGVKLLKESLQSKTVLTNVFLEKKSPKIDPLDELLE